MIFGALAALLGRRGPRVRAWFVRGLVALTVFLATALLAYARCADWMWMYFLEPPALSATDIGFMALLLYYLPYLAAWGLAREAEQRWPRRGGYAVLGISAILNVYIVARLWDRYFHVGSRAEYLAGRAPTLAEPNVLTGVLNAGGAALAVTVVVLVVTAVREARRPA